MKAIRLVFCLGLLLTTTQLWAEPVNLTFMESATRPVTGVTIAGLTVSLAMNGKACDQAVYGAPLPGSRTNVGSPALATQTLSTRLFTEVFFDPRSVLMASAVLTLNATVSTFTLDQLAFHAVAVPEPAALVLLGTGLAVVAALTKKRKTK